MHEQRKSQALGKFTVLSNGSELMIEVPKTAQVVAGTKFLLSIQTDGTLTYHPISNNPWLNGDYADIDFLLGHPST
ncbi:hypothetical protein ACYATP_06560 [Lactobacillaceae bacterium Melli_B4]